MKSEKEKDKWIRNGGFYNSAKFTTEEKSAWCLFTKRWVA